MPFYMKFGMITWYGMSHQSQRQEIIDDEAIRFSEDRRKVDTVNNGDALRSQLLIDVVPDDEYEYHWLDVAKSQHSGPYNDDLVEEVKSVYSVFGFLSFMTMYWLVYAASPSLFYSQGCQMDYYIGSFEMPIAMLQDANCISVFILIPLFDRLVYPWLKESAHCNFGMLRKIGVGYFMIALAMIAAGLVEIRRKESKTLSITSTCDSSIYISELSVLWQIPQYFFVGVSRVFAYVVSFEFFSGQAPESMKAIVYSLNLTTFGLGSLLVQGLLVIVDLWTPEWIPDNLDDGHLEYYFFLVAAIMLLTLFLFIPYAMRYTYKPGTDPWDTESVQSSSSSSYTPITPVIDGHL